MKRTDMMIDFTGVYEPAREKLPGWVWLDLRDIEGTDMYCSPEAADAIRRRLAPFGFRGIHLIDSGNYHYMTGFFTEQIRQPFALVYFDHHTDMQEPMAAGLLSCGDWVREVLRSQPLARQILMIGPEEKAVREAFPDRRQLHRVLEGGRVIAVSRQTLLKGSCRPALARLRPELPLYISIDKDVLGRQYAMTNWDQGTMTPVRMNQILRVLLRRRTLLGADICGEYPLDEGITAQSIQAWKLNRRENRQLVEVIGRFMRQEGKY